MTLNTVAGFTLAALLTLPLTGCRPDAALKKDEVIGRGTIPNSGPPPTPGNAVPDAAPLANAGSVAGTVLFSGKPPARVAIDTSMDPACAYGGEGSLTSEQYVVTAGKLANVFVYVKSGPAAAMKASAPAAPTVLDQRGCRYVPHVVGVAQGGFVEFRNSDPTMHNIHTMPTTVGNETVDISQGPKGAPVTRRFDHAELMMPVRCNNHPWMNAFINVAPTPFFAVSDASGHFDLRGLPPGDYTLGAMHEKLGEKTIQVNVSANGIAKVDLRYGLSN